MSIGPVEALTRLGAHVLARSLLEAGHKVVLLTAGGAGKLRFIEHPADLVELWTLRTLEPAEPVSNDPARA